MHSRPAPALVQPSPAQSQSHLHCQCACRVECTCAQPILHEREWSQLQQKLEQETRVGYKLAGARPAAQVTLRMWLGRSSDDFGIDHMFDDKDCEIAAFAEIVRLYSTLLYSILVILQSNSYSIRIRIRSTSSRS